MVFWKKIFFIYKSVVLQIYLLKVAVPKDNITPKELKIKSTLDKVAVPKVTTASAIVYKCSSKISAILYE